MTEKIKLFLRSTISCGSNSNVTICLLHKCSLVLQISKVQPTFKKYKPLYIYFFECLVTQMDQAHDFIFSNTIRCFFLINKTKPSHKERILKGVSNVTYMKYNLIIRPFHGRRSSAAAAAAAATTRTTTTTTEKTAAATLRHVQTQQTQMVNQCWFNAGSTS